MSRFYADISGSRGPATRQGTAYSGMYAHARGWHVGGSVEMRAEGETDTAHIYATSGSANNLGREYIGKVTNEAGELVLEPSVWVIEQVRLHKLAQRRLAARAAKEGN